MKKVIVVGSGGAGKSTFARRLGHALNLDVIHLDKLYWKPNWVKTPQDEWDRVVKELIARDSWIIDGNFGGTREMRMKACDTVIWLNTPRRICLYRILQRALLYRNKQRPDMAQGCSERFDWDFIKWVWKYPHRAKSRIAVELEQFRHKRIVVLRSKREIDDFFERLG